MGTRSSDARTISAFLILLLVAGCSAEETPEERVRAYIDQVAESAEARDWRAFGAYVADDYADVRGFTKQEVLAIVARYILANQRIHILKRVADVRIEQAGRASAVVYAAIAGQPVAKVDDLARITADVYRFEVDLTTSGDGGLQATKGDWRPVAVEDFLIGD